MDDVDSIQAVIVGFPHPPGAGGPGSFQFRFESELNRTGWRTAYLSETKVKPDVVVIVGGSRKILRILFLKLRGVPIVYRLDGILWLQRKQWTGLGAFLIKESQNVLCKLTHAFLADYVVYQSRFVCDWWERCGWWKGENSAVIHNGVNLNTFSDSNNSGDAGEHITSRDIVCVEGHVDYSPYAIELVNQLANMLQVNGIKIRMYGGFANQQSQTYLSHLVDYRGSIPRSEVHNVYRNGIYLSLDVNAACPNTVIEAMSCGLPVVGFDTGALLELVPRECGRVVDYGGDPWALDFPDVESLHSAILEIVSNYSWFSRNARQHAEQQFDVEKVTARYIEVFEEVIGQKNEVS